MFACEDTYNIQKSNNVSDSASNEAPTLLQRCSMELGGTNDFDPSIGGVHIIALGDSTMLQQVEHFAHWLRSSRTSDQADSDLSAWSHQYVSIAGDVIYNKFDDLATGLSSAINFATTRNKTIVLLFNVGMWEKNLCYTVKDDPGHLGLTRYSESILADPDTLTSTSLGRGEGCLAFYKENMRRLMEHLKDLEKDSQVFSMKIFRTTWAGYVKTGNWGFSWPTNELQYLSTSQTAMKAFNSEAVKVSFGSWARARSQRL